MFYIVDRKTNMVIGEAPTWDRADTHATIHYDRDTVNVIEDKTHWKQMEKPS